MKLLSIGKWHVCRLTFSLCIKDITYMYVWLATNIRETEVL